MYLQQQTQALALTRPKTPKKEQSGSPGGSNHSRQQSESSLRSPISDIVAVGARSITKTPNIHTTNNDSGGGGDVNSPHGKIPQSPLPPSEKLNHHTSDNSHNNNGVSQQQREQQQQQQQQFAASHTLLNGPEKILPSPSVERKDFDFSKVNGELKIQIFLFVSLSILFQILIEFKKIHF